MSYSLDEKLRRQHSTAVVLYTKARNRYRQFSRRTRPAWVARHYQKAQVILQLIRVRIYKTWEAQE